MALTRPKLAQIDTNVTVIIDPIVVLNRDSAANVDIGHVMNRGIESNVALFWDESNNSFAAAYTNSDGIATANIVITEYADFRANVISANTVTSAGNITASSGYFIGDGSLLTGIASPDKINKDASNVTVTSDFVNIAISSSNIASISSNGLALTGNLQLLTAPLAAIYGGTGIMGYSKGDILYASDTNVLSVLPISSEYSVLQINSNGVPSWGTIDGGTYEGE